MNMKKTVLALFAAMIVSPVVAVHAAATGGAACPGVACGPGQQQGQGQAQAQSQSQTQGQAQGQAQSLTSSNSNANSNNVDVTAQGGQGGRGGSSSSSSYNNLDLSFHNEDRREFATPGIYLYPQVVTTKDVDHGHYYMGAEKLIYYSLTMTRQQARDIIAESGGKVEVYATPSPRYAATDCVTLIARRVNIDAMLTMGLQELDNQATAFAKKGDAYMRSLLAHIAIAAMDAGVNLVDLKGDGTESWLESWAWGIGISYTYAHISGDQKSSGTGGGGTGYSKAHAKEYKAAYLQASFLLVPGKSCQDMQDLAVAMRKSVVLEQQALLPPQYQPIPAQPTRKGAVGNPQATHKVQ